MGRAELFLSVYEPGRTQKYRLVQRSSTYVRQFDPARFRRENPQSEHRKKNMLNPRNVPRRTRATGGVLPSSAASGARTPSGKRRTSRRAASIYRAGRIAIGRHGRRPSRPRTTNCSIRQSARTTRHRRVYCVAVRVRVFFLFFPPSISRLFLRRLRGTLPDPTRRIPRPASHANCVSWRRQPQHQQHQSSSCRILFRRQR